MTGAILKQLVDTPRTFSRAFEDSEGRKVRAVWAGNRAAGIRAVHGGALPLTTSVTCLVLVGTDGPMELSMFMEFHKLLVEMDRIARKGGGVPARHWATTYHRIAVRPCIFAAIDIVSDVNAPQNIEVITFLHCFATAYFRLSGAA